MAKIRSIDYFDVASLYENSMFGSMKNEFGKIRNSKVWRYARKACESIAREARFLAYDVPRFMIKEKLGIPEDCSIKEGIKNIAKGIFYSVKSLPSNIKDPGWWESHKYDLIPILFSAATCLYCLYIYSVKTRYHLDLSRIANAKLYGMPKTIGEYWSEGKMPVQWSNTEIINLGHTSPNPFEYVKPSISIKGGIDTIISFSLRDQTVDESKILKAFQDGAFTGIPEYLAAAEVDAALVTGYVVGKHAGKKIKRNNK